jgi:ubiquinone/menaquinone biosynthesis C-methylase UbiE
MPEFYNRAIHLEQRLALHPWLNPAAGSRVLDVGCGVGRWSRQLAKRGAVVTGVDLSPTMIAEAQRRARSDGVDRRCQFRVQDLSELELSSQFDTVLAVTVLQHILDPAKLQAAVTSMARHLAPGGRMVVLEAAPDRDVSSCNTSIFKARHRDVYLELFQQCGLRLSALTGVDPAPFRTRLLPHVRKLSPRLSGPLLAVATGLSIPVNAVFGRRALRSSWHAVFVLEHGENNGH